MGADKDTALLEWGLADGCAVKGDICHKRCSVDHNRAVYWLWCWQCVALQRAGRGNLLRHNATLMSLLASLEDICARAQSTAPALLALKLLVNPNLSTIWRGEGDGCGIGSKVYLLSNLFARNNHRTALRVIARSRNGIVIAPSWQDYAHSAISKGVVLIVNNHNRTLRLNSEDHKLRLKRRLIDILTKRY